MNTKSKTKMAVTKKVAGGVAGGVAGAAVGAAVGGPVGALIGGLAGAVVGDRAVRRKLPFMDGKSPATRKAGSKARSSQAGKAKTQRRPVASEPRSRRSQAAAKRNSAPKDSRVKS